MDFIQKYNPDNIANLTEEDIKALPTLTDDQIAQLAAAYPNKPTGNSYLLIFDSKVAFDKQAGQLSTWQNLNNLRKFNNMKNMVAGGVRNRRAPRSARVNATRVTTRRTIDANDLTAEQAAAELEQQLNPQQNTRQSMSAATLGGRPLTKEEAAAQKAAPVPQRTQTTSGQAPTQPLSPDEDFGDGIS